MERIMEAAQAGNVEALYKSLEQDPSILQHIDGIPFVNTPLHVAASAGHTTFALEIMSLKPSFGRKLNPDGLSPLHLALQRGQSETVERLIKLDPELIRVKGKEMLTPLHYAATNEHVKLLAKFLCVCPESINDLTIREESALHIAVNNFNPAGAQKPEAFEVILEWVWRTYNRRVLNWRDDRGNTARQIALSSPTKKTQIVALLDKKLARIRRPKEAAKPGDNPDPDLVGYFTNSENFYERWLRSVLYWRRDLTMQMRNAVLVVAVLIATATFQAVITPPQGVKDSLPETGVDSHAATGVDSLAACNGTGVDSLAAFDGTGLEFALVFYALNTVAFTASINVIVLVLHWRPFSVLLHASLMFIVASYGISLFRIKSLSWGTVGLIIPSWAFSWLCYCVKNLFWEVHLKSEMLRRSSIGFLGITLSDGVKERLHILQSLVGEI